VHDLHLIDDLAHHTLLNTLNSHILDLLLLAPLEDLAELALADLLIDMVLVHSEQSDSPPQEFRREMDVDRYRE
jgi:hypothetical protein